VDRKMLDLDVDTVVIDNVSAACELAEHLIRNGHRRIGGVFGPTTMTTSRERYEGYQKALKAHGLPVPETLVRVGIPKEPFGYQSAKDLLSLAEPPTALLMANNLLALGAMRAIHELGLRIPQDVCLATFDNEAWTAFAQPPLTVVDQPTYELGRKAGELLFQRMADNTSVPTLTTLQAQLIIRGSSVRPASQ
jgi:DNA-binding LacI/PurR family transcriptional regulator